jgi:tRNA G26 N,N-dimethylase Trm1
MEQAADYEEIIRPLVLVYEDGYVKIYKVVNE